MKVRIRFLSDLDDGIKVPFHDHYERGINVPCQESLGRDCPYCEEEGLRTRDQYCWPVWNYDANEVQILAGAANAYSPIPAIVGIFEAYGTLLDRDIVITKNGTQTSTTYSVIPMDKVKFNNSKAKPFSEEKMLSILDKAYPADASEDDEDEKPVKKAKKPARDDDDDEEEYEAPKKKKKPPVDEDDEDEDDEPAPKKKAKKHQPMDPQDYEDCSARELYDECVARDIEVLAKKSEAYYIKRLEAWDEENEDDLPW